MAAMRVVRVGKVMRQSSIDIETSSLGQENGPPCCCRALWEFAMLLLIRI